MRIGSEVDECEPTFAFPWEARAFALATSLRDRGVFDSVEWRDALSSAIAESPDSPYYERWLTALECLLSSRGILSSD